MPRSAREKSSSGIYHVMLRGINRQSIFEDDEDKEKFLKTLRKYKEISQYELYSYCLMNNHVHLLLKESGESVSTIIKRISSSYVFWYNKKYDRSGHLFQGRFKSEKVESQAYFLTVIRYIHQNPLKAGLAKDVFTSPWTSINEYMHKSQMVDIHFVLDLFSWDDREALRLFIEFMKQPNKDECLELETKKEKLSDHEVREYLIELGVENTSVLQQMDKEVRDKTLARLKNIKGVTLRQLARITGISKSVIQRAR